jgi:DNA primase
MGTSYRRACGTFSKASLPDAADYFASEGLKLHGGGVWRSALCPFHADTRPSLRIRLDTGSFRCMACGAHGGDILQFHRLRYGLTFRAAAAALGAWSGA